jgi:DNA-binding NtrC family response regulator
MTMSGEGMMIIELDATLAEAVKKHIIRTLVHCSGNRTRAAKILGISLRCLRNKLHRYEDAGVDVVATRQPKSKTRSLRTDIVPTPSFWS